MNFTLVYIVQDNLNDLKQNLAHNLEKLGLYGDIDCLIVDDGSVENLKNYLNVHFPEVRYLKNTFQEGFNESLFKAFNIVKSDFALVLEPSIRIDYCDIRSICDEMLNNRFFISVLPVISNVSKLPFFFQLFFNQGRLDMKHLYKQDISGSKLRIFISEAMIFDVRRYHISGGLNKTYFTALYALFDLVFNSFRLGWGIHSTHLCSLIKQNKSEHFFSYLHVQDDVYRDEFSFIWFNIRSSRYLISYFFGLFKVLFSFKVKQLKAFILNMVMWPFIKINRIKPRWHYLNDHDLLSAG
ncbi:MAG: hypothetical protein CMP39_05070 [Rickettsiales bacterium]|nr:hypothetical protein [Rickettsiales bacterium]